MNSDMAVLVIAFGATNSSSVFSFIIYYSGYSMNHLLKTMLIENTTIFKKNENKN